MLWLGICSPPRYGSVTMHLKTCQTQLQPPFLLYNPLPNRSIFAFLQPCRRFLASSWLAAMAFRTDNGRTMSIDTGRTAACEGKLAVPRAHAAYSPALTPSVLNFPLQENLEHGFAAANLFLHPPLGGAKDQINKYERFLTNVNSS